MWDWFKLSIETDWGQDWDEWNQTKPEYNAPGHQLGYDPAIHQEGKGLLFEDGDVWTWPTHKMRPQHMEYNMRAKRLDKRAVPGAAFHIAPNGLVWQYGEGRSLDEAQKRAITQADPRLQFDNAPAQSIPSTVQPPRDFGHARNVLDILNRKDRERGKLASFLWRWSKKNDSRSSEPLSQNHSAVDDTEQRNAHQSAQTDLHESIHATKPLTPDPHQDCDQFGFDDEAREEHKDNWSSDQPHHKIHADHLAHPQTRAQEKSGQAHRMPASRSQRLDTTRSHSSTWRGPKDFRKCAGILHNKGEWARGLVTPQGEVHTWPEEYGTHNAYIFDVLHAGSPQGYDKFTIDPHGTVYGVSHPGNRLRVDDALNPLPVTSAVNDRLDNITPDPQASWEWMKCDHQWDHNGQCKLCEKHRETSAISHPATQELREAACSKCKGETVRVSSQLVCSICGEIQ